MYSLVVRLRAPSLRMMLGSWFGSEVECSKSGNEASLLVWE